MTDNAREFREVLAERVSLVAEITELNARQLRNSQMAGGVEIELLAARRTLEDAEARDARLKVELAGGEARLAELDERLEQLDRELARVSTG